MDYNYIPLPERQPLVWPNGARVALILTFNLETWDLTKDTDKPYYAGGPSILPDILPGNASCTTNAVTFERRKAMTDAVLKRGWELLTHNWEQGELLSNFAGDPAKEREVVLRTLDAFEQHTGRKSKGWLSSSLRGTLQTADILAEYGATFYCDIMNDDQPYLLKTPNGPLVSVPYSNEINDFTFITRKNFTTDQFSQALIEELDVLYEEAATTGRIMNVGLHPHVSGRAHRIRAIREFIQHAQSLPGVWWATREEIAARMREKGDAYGLLRRNCVSFVIPGRPIAVLNMTHVETPLEPFSASANTL
eukprot:gene29797-33598_t